MDLSLIFSISHTCGLFIPFWQCNETFKIIMHVIYTLVIVI